MSRVVENGASSSPSPLIKELKCEDDDLIGKETQAHQVLDMSIEEPRFLPFILSFTHLTYSVEVRRKVNLFGRRPASEHVNSGQAPHVSAIKIILNDVSAEARNGEIMAVMGASGAGKSTLIDALANRMAKGSLNGSITLNGENLESSLLKVISAYIMQDDLLFPMLTVEETLMFAAEFRLPRRLSNFKKNIRVQALIDQLGLQSAAKTIIGDEGHRGISSGERRRVSIGVDIIHDPILLFLDEPTSGLDSTSAFMVVKVLKKIAESGSIVIMSIHQPSNRLLGLLNRVIFLSRGQTVYCGPPSNMPMFFSHFGRPIPDNDNQTEFALDLISELEGSPEGIKSLLEFNKSWLINNQNYNNSSESLTAKNASGSNLSLKEAIVASISRGKLVSGATATTSINASGPVIMVPTFANPLWMEMVVLSKRSFINSRRMPKVFRARLGSVIVTGFMLSILFWRLDTSSKAIQERLGFYTLIVASTLYTCADALPVFLQERYIFMRETAFNAYRRSSYVLSHAIVSLPALTILSLAMATTTFWSVGLDGSLFFFILVIMASFWAGISFVTFLSGVVHHVMLGYTIIISVLAYLLLFSGFFINPDRLSPCFIWIHHLALAKYPYEAALQNEFNDPEKCFVRGIQIFDGLGKAVPKELKVKLFDSLKVIGINSTSCVTTGADVLQQIGITPISKWNDLWVTVAWGVLFRILFYVSLVMGNKNKRK